jgi:hypothetical protein
MVSRLLALAVSLATALSASADPGHGDPTLADGWLHYLAEPRHAIAFMGAIALCLAIASIGARRRAALRAALREARRV